MKTKIKITVIAMIGMSFGINAQVFNSLTASGSNKKIEWTTSSWGSGFGHKIYNFDPGGKTLLNIAARHNNSNWTDLMTFTSYGKVGIGTNDPSEKLSVNGNISTSGDLKMSGSNKKIEWTTSSWGSGFGHKIYSFDPGGKTLLNIAARHNNSNWTDLMTFTSYGKVGIGTNDPDSKLTVAGNIHSREVKVTIDAGADFVFEKEYKLPTLESIEKFVKINKHLPEIASEKEMKKNGLLLAEMNIKLLQKIEELTLYTIQQQKEIETLKLFMERLTKIEEQLKKKN
jgi:hypothetical protein